VFYSKLVELSLIKEGGSKTVVTLPQIKYEVDVYTKKDGTVSEWCKIDVELDSILPLINKETGGKPARIIIKVSHLPFKPVDSMLGSSQVHEHKKIMSRIWDTEWNLPPFDEVSTSQSMSQPPVSKNRLTQDVKND
jgi:hypothetical protein